MRAFITFLLILANTAASAQQFQFRTPQIADGAITSPKLASGAAQANLGWQLKGNTSVLATMVGAYTTGHALAIDANGNIVDAGYPAGSLSAPAFPALTGDVTTPGGSLVTTIANGAVTSAKLALGAAAGNLGAGTVTNSMLANSAVTVNGVPCTLGAPCTLGVSAPGLLQSTLKATSISGLAAGVTLTRVGYSAPGDSQPIVYTLSTSACSLNSGAGDNGSQVKPNVGTGCWIWTPPANGATPKEFGAAGNGTTDDTTAVQAAHEATSKVGIPLRFGPPNLYKVTHTVNFDTPGDWEGPYRYGVWSSAAITGGSSQVATCPWGLVASSASMGDLVRASATTGTIRGVCLDATGSTSTQATAGAGINLSPLVASGLGSYQSGWTIELNTVFNPYDGIDINGAGYNGGACCGAGSAADGVSVQRNTIINPARYGISNGLLSSGATTVGITYLDNAIMCGANGTSRGVAGFALFDGGITYDGTNNGPEGCTVGFLVAPGAISNGAGGYSQQNAQLVLRGALGDQSVTHDVVFKPTTTGGVGGIIDFVQCDSCWAGATGNYNSILIDCTTASTSCQEFTFSNLVAHGGGGLTDSVFKVLGGAGGPYDLTIANSNICQFGSPGAGSTALNLQLAGSPTGRMVINGNRIGTGCPGGSMATGINLSISGSSSGGAVTITSNDMSSVATPVVYTPTPTDHVIMKNNMGIDDQIGSIASANAITPPISYNSVGLSGTTTVQSIAGGYTNRQITFTATSGTVAFATGGASNQGVCNAASVSQYNSITATFNAGWGCWVLH